MVAPARVSCFSWKVPGIQQITAATSNKLTAKCKCIVYCCQSAAQRWGIWLEGREAALTGQRVLHCKSYLVVTAFIEDWKDSATSVPPQMLMLIAFAFPGCSLDDPALTSQVWLLWLCSVKIRPFIKYVTTRWRSWDANTHPSNLISQITDWREKTNRNLWSVYCSIKQIFVFFLWWNWSV